MNSREFWSHVWHFFPKYSKISIIAGTVLGLMLTAITERIEENTFDANNIVYTLLIFSSLYLLILPLFANNHLINRENTIKTIEYDDSSISQIFSRTYVYYLGFLFSTSLFFPSLVKFFHRKEYFFQNIHDFISELPLFEFEIGLKYVIFNGIFYCFLSVLYIKMFRFIYYNIEKNHWKKFLIILLFCMSIFQVIIFIS